MLYCKAQHVKIINVNINDHCICDLNKVKTTEKHTNLFCGCGLNFFHPQEVPILKQHIYLSPVIFFWLKTPKDTANAPAVDALRLNSLRDIKTAFSTTEWYDKHPCLFIWPRCPSTGFQPWKNYFTGRNT